eukprot:SAG31_NODE_25022_length_469_cov_1.540541_1_plen_147_part_10
MCPLLEKYGTFIAKCNALIEKVSPFIARFDARIDRGSVEAGRATAARKALEDEKVDVQKQVAQQQDDLAGKQEAFTELEKKLVKEDGKRKKIRAKNVQLLNNLKKFDAELQAKQKEVQEAEAGARQYCGHAEEIDSRFDTALLLSKI